MPARLTKALGFARPIHFFGWLLTAGVLIGFTAYRSNYMYFDSYFCSPEPRNASAAGECFHFRRNPFSLLGIKTHLWCILPAGFLAGFQFLPALRRRAYIRIHRLSGYVSIILSTVATLAILPVLRHSFGGDVPGQVITVLLLVLFLGAQAAGYVSVKKGDIVRHRQWMLRAWSWGSSIISLRIIMIITSVIISHIGGYYLAMPCDKISYVLKTRENTLKWYPECLPYFTEGDVSRRAIVDAKLFGRDGIESVAALNLTYSMSAWLAFFIHFVAAELHIQSGRLVGQAKPANKTN